MALAHPVRGAALMAACPKPKPREKKPPKPIRKNVQRSADEFVRCYLSEDRVEWVKSLPCIVPDCMSLSQSENAHIEGGGTGRKADYTKIVPLCPGHHRRWAHSLHNMGREGVRGPPLGRS